MLDNAKMQKVHIGAAVPPEEVVEIANTMIQFAKQIHALTMKFVCLTCRARALTTLVLPKPKDFPQKSRLKKRIIGRISKYMMWKMISIPPCKIGSRKYVIFFKLFFFVSFLTMMNVMNNL